MYSKRFSQNVYDCDSLFWILYIRRRLRGTRCYRLYNFKQQNSSKDESGLF